MNEKGKKIQSGQIRVEIAQAEDLKPYGRNARVHTPEAVRRLAAIISEMGWTSPILIDGQGVVAGHKRRLAALEIYAGGGATRGRSASGRVGPGNRRVRVVGGAAPGVCYRRQPDHA